MSIYRLIGAANLGLLLLITSVLSFEVRAGQDDLVSISDAEASKIKEKIARDMNKLEQYKLALEKFVEKEKRAEVSDPGEHIYQYVRVAIRDVFGNGAVWSAEQFKTRFSVINNGYGDSRQVSDGPFLDDLRRHGDERPLGRYAFSRLPGLSEWQDFYRDVVHRHYMYEYALGVGKSPESLKNRKVPIEEFHKVFTDLVKGIEAMFPNPEDIKASAPLPQWVKNWLLESE